MSVLVELSYGELIDKITILEIKASRISETAKLANVRNELRILHAVRAEKIPDTADLRGLTERLRETNERLWDVEDKLRKKEREKNFDSEFVELARSVYRLNDRRSRIKCELNEVLGSRITEEKSYQTY